MGIVSILQQEGDFGFCLLSSDSKFGCYCEFGNNGRVWKESFAVALEDSVNEVIIQEMLEVLVLHVIVKVVIEARVIDSVYVYMLMGSRRGFWKKELYC